MEYNESILIRRSDAEPAPAALKKQQMTLHCAQCNTVLGDSAGVCGEMKCLDSIVCSRVTNDVVISDAKELGHIGDVANCVYSPLRCRDCCCTVGKVILSAPSHLATVRLLFLLHKANLNCYILNSSSMVEAASLTFDLKPLNDSIEELRKQFKAQLDQMFCIKNKLANRSVTNELDK